MGALTQLTDTCLAQESVPRCAWAHNEGSAFAQPHSTRIGSTLQHMHAYHWTPESDMQHRREDRHRAHAPRAACQSTIWVHRERIPLPLQLHVAVWNTEGHFRRMLTMCRCSHAVAARGRERSGIPRSCRRDETQRIRCLHHIRCDPLRKNIFQISLTAIIFESLCLESFSTQAQTLSWRIDV